MLTQRELLLISARMGATEFLGVPDAFLGMGEAEIQQEISAIHASLEQKGYAAFGFDGDLQLTDEIKNAVGICAHCDVFITAEKKWIHQNPIRELYYVKEGAILHLLEAEKGNVLLSIDSTDELIASITSGDGFKTAAPQFTASLTIPNTVLTEAKNHLSGFDPSKGVSVLMSNGCDEAAAHAIWQGLSGSADFTAVAVVVFKGEQPGVRSAMFIDAGNSIIRMSPVGSFGKEAVHFETVSRSQAQEAIAEVIKNAIL
jgi:hypothetical protein